MGSLGCNLFVHHLLHVLLFKECLLSNCKYYCFSRSLNNLRSVEKNRIRIPVYVLSSADILYDWGWSWFAFRVDSLIDFNIHLFNEQTISWNSVSRLKMNDITDNEVFSKNSRLDSILATENIWLFLLDFLAKSQNLLFTDVVTHWLHEACNQKYAHDGWSDSPSIGVTFCE
jgi:hypothetical protein